MVSGLERNTYEEKCAELGLKTLMERRTAQDMALVHKFLTGKGNLGLFPRTSNQQRSRTRQAARKLDSVDSMLEPTQESIHLQRGQWNAGTDCWIP